MPAKLHKSEIKAEDDYDLDEALDGPVVSNFLEKDRETISPRELTFRKDEMRVSEDASYPVATVVAFILACCIAHFLLVTQGFIGTKGMEKADGFAAKIQDFFTKHSITIPEGVQLIYVIEGEFGQLRVPILHTGNALLGQL